MKRLKGRERRRMSLFDRECFAQECGEMFDCRMKSARRNAAGNRRAAQRDAAAAGGVAAAVLALMENLSGFEEYRRSGMQWARARQADAEEMLRTLRKMESGT